MSDLFRMLLAFSHELDRGLVQVARAMKLL